MRPPLPERNPVSAPELNDVYIQGRQYRPLRDQPPQGKVRGLQGHPQERTGAGRERYHGQYHG